MCAQPKKPSRRIWKVKFGNPLAIFARIVFDFVEKSIALHSNWDESVDDVIVRFIIPEKDENCALKLRNRLDESGR